METDIEWTLEKQEILARRCMSHENKSSKQVIMGRWVVTLQDMFLKLWLILNYVCMYEYICVLVYVYISVCVCMYVSVQVSIEARAI